MQRKKILYIITKGNWGGAQRYVFDLAVNLPPGEFETVVACNGAGIFAEKLRVFGIRTVFLPSLQREISLGKEIKALYELVRLLTRERPAIVHLNSSKAAGLGALASRLFSVFSFLMPSAYRLAPKIIFTVHGWPFNEPLPFLERAAIFFLSWFTALLSHEVIVICRADLYSAQRLWFIRKKTRLIHNGIVPFATMERGAGRTILAPDAPPEAALIVTIAELTKNKGLTHALRAVSELSRERDLPLFQYIIIGEGEQRVELEKMILEKNLSGFVRLAGFILNAQTLLSGADIFLLPSLKEGLPYVLLEAGATGVSVVATNVGGVSDIISDRESGMLILPKREKEIADALRFLLINHRKRDAFGAALKEKVLRESGFEKMLADTMAAYQNTTTH